MGKFQFVEGQIIKQEWMNMFEGKFRDIEQENETYIYANLSDFDSESFEDCNVYVYAHSYLDLYCPDEYFLSNICITYGTELKEVLLEKYKQAVEQNVSVIKEPEVHFYDIVEGNEIK